MRPSHTDRQRSKVIAHAAPQSPKGEEPPAPKPNYPFSPHFPSWKETFINSKATPEPPTGNARPQATAPADQAQEDAAWPPALQRLADWAAKNREERLIV